MVTNAMGARRFRRVIDGVLGLGYYINWAGLKQASVAWPDVPACRYVPDDFTRQVIEDMGEVKVCDQSCVVIDHSAMILSVNESATYETFRSPDELSIQLPTEATPELQLADKTSQSRDGYAAIEDYLAANPGVAIAQAVEHLATIDIEVTSAQVASVRERIGLNAAVSDEPFSEPPSE